MTDTNGPVVGDEQIVSFVADETSGGELKHAPLYEDPSSMFYDDRNDADEPFSKIIARAKAKKRQGDQLTEKERWALTREQLHTIKNRVNGYTSAKAPARGPSKRTVDRIRKVCELQLVEGLKQKDIAEQLGMGESNLSHLVSRNAALYHRLLQEVSDEITASAKLIRPAVYGRVIEKLRKAALSAPDVVETIMNDPDQPGGVRLQAAGRAMEAYGVGKNGQEVAGATLSDESKKLLQDTIGVIEALTGRDVPSEAELLPAEGES